MAAFHNEKTDSYESVTVPKALINQAIDDNIEQNTAKTVRLGRELSQNCIETVQLLSHCTIP
jgi:hypothetical protein